MRNATRKKLSLVEIETKEVLAEGFTPFIQGYADGLLDALDGTIGSRVQKPVIEDRVVKGGQALLACPPDFSNAINRRFGSLW